MPFVSKNKNKNQGGYIHWIIQVDTSRIQSMVPLVGHNNNTLEVQACPSQNYSDLVTLLGPP